MKSKFSGNYQLFCPSCCAKRAALWAEFVRERVIRPVPHRHFVFALPKVLRPAFRYRRRLLPKFALCAWKALSSFLREDTGGDAQDFSRTPARRFPTSRMCCE